MLLYNHRQEFIGIDDEGLQLLNYASLEELLSVCSDVADLFANEPGYIHNFKSFGWIDFLLHSDSDASSAIVHGNGRTFSCQLGVTSFHLCAHPSENGYSIEMSQIKSISGEEIKPHALTPKTPTKEFAPPSEPIQTLQTAPLLDYTHLAATQLTEPTLLDIPKTQPTSLDETDDIYASLMAPLSADELYDSPEGRMQESDKLALNPIKTPIPTVKHPMLGNTQYSTEEAEYLSQHKVDTTYMYDPNVAANELGLPVDLIEEFIGDFIQQSHDFKDELFESALKSDINTLHILSHKLKGVAANLRVENAFETLSVINSSTDSVEIEANLKYYYALIAKLEDKEILDIQDSPLEKQKEIKPATALISDPVEDIYAFSLKENENESLLVQLDDIDLKGALFADVKEEVPFKKELLELEDESIETVPTEKINSVPALHYDLQSVAGALGMEPAFMEELLHEYKTDASAMNTTIIQAIKSFDTHTWRSSAAKLKGISDNLRLIEISDELAILSITNDAQEAKKSFLRLSSYLDQL